MQENRFKYICKTCLGYLLDHQRWFGYKKCNICGETKYDGGLMIDWTNPKSKISKYFTVGEATYLPKLKKYYIPNEKEKENILKLAKQLDVVREYVGKAFNVNIWIRPVTTDDNGNIVDYNALIGGAKNSAHKEGSAVDLTVSGMTAQEVRDVLKDKLEEFNLRMEDDVTWCHFDNRRVPSGGKRIFKV